MHLTDSWLIPTVVFIDGLFFQAFYYPEHVGFPIGKTDSPKIIILEIHYDNPNNVEGT